MKLKYLIDAWLVILLALGFGAALAGVHIGLSPRIEQNKLEKTLRQIPQVVPGAVKEKSQGVEIDDVTVYKAFDESDKHIGWVVPAKGDGYADKIELLIGLNPDVTQITGIAVLSQKETPALGDKINNESFRDRFRDKPTDQPLAVRKDGGTIEAITAATVSSRAVCDIVNAAVKQWRPKLKERKQTG